MKKWTIRMAMMFAGMLWAEPIPEPNLHLEIQSGAGEIGLSGVTSTNFDYFLLRSTNLTDWVEVEEFSTPSNQPYSFVETNQQPIAYYKRVLSKTQGAGLLQTGNPSAPFAAVGPNGDIVVPLVDSNDTSKVTGALFVSAYGDSAMVQLGSNGLPRVLASEDYVFYFTDWTNNTVDVWYIYTNGMTNVAYDVAVDPELMARVEQPAGPLALGNQLFAPLSDGDETPIEIVQETLSIGITGINIGVCAVSLASIGFTGGAAIPAAIPVAIGSCGSAAFGIAELFTGNPWFGMAGSYLSLGTALFHPSGWIETSLLAVEAATAATGLLLERIEAAEPHIQNIQHQYDTTLVTVIPTPAEGGQTNEYYMLIGVEIWITATPNNGWEFDKWSDGETNQSRLIETTSAPSEYVAEFRRTDIPTNGLVAYYPFDGDAMDHSGNGHHGTVHGATLTAGISGQAYSFDGVDDFINVGDNGDVLGGDFTVSTWIKSTDYHQYAKIINKGQTIAGTPKNSGYSIRFIDFSWSGTGNPEFLFQFNDDGNRWVTTIVPVENLPVNQFFLATGVLQRNGSSVVAKLYINGVLKSSSTAEGITSSNTNIPLGIGALYRGAYGPTRELFDGKIDQVRIYNRALSAAEISALYQSGQ